MSILVTGGTGFIGAFVVRSLLELGETPVVLDLGEPGFSLQDLLGQFVFVKGGVTDFDFLCRTMNAHGVDQVIHLAALLQYGCEQDPKRAIEVNVQGTTNVLEASRKMRVKKIVFASSGAVYGPQAGLLNEDSPISPVLSLYGATKFLGEVLLERYHRIHGIPYIALRYSGPYGPGEVRSAGLAEVIKQIESTILGKKAVIETLTGDEKRSFVFIKDVARATLKALSASKNTHKVFNIAGGDDSFVTFAEFHRAIKRLHPSAGEVIFKGKVKEQERGKIDISRAREELDYYPEYSLKKGILEDIEFFLAHK